MKRSILHNDLALDRILRIQHKGICMWCPRILHISNLLPYAGTSRQREHRAQRALCPNCRRGPLCLCAQGLHLSRTIRIQKQATSTVATRTGGSNFHQLFPRSALASQGPCVEPSGQQSTPCRGSTTVQRPVLTGKRVVVKHFKPARPTALSHPIA